MAGRPRLYESVEDIEKVIDSYFNQEVIVDSSSKDGIEHIRTGRFEPIAKPTVTGLALHLGFADKTTLYEYRDRPEFSYPIKRALTMIEQYHELGLCDNNVAGRIFALKNMGWRDKVETGFTNNNGDDLQPQIIFQPAPNCNEISNTTEE